MSDDNYTEAQYLADRDVDYYFEKERRQEEIDDEARRLSAMTDSELLDFICSQGEALNTLLTFKTYDVAKRLKDNKWTPTKKQREALINTAAIALNT